MEFSQYIAPCLVGVPLLIIVLYLIYSYMNGRGSKPLFSGLKEDGAKRYVLFIVLLGALLRLLTVNMLMVSDEAVYVMAAKQVYGGLGLYVDFFLAHPPAYPLVTSWIFSLLGVGVWQAKIIPVVLSIGCIPLIYLIARRFYGFRAALLSAFVFSISVGVVQFTRSAMMFSEMIFFSLLAILFLFDGIERKNYWGILLSGLCLGIAMLYRLFAIIPLVSILVYLLIQRMKNWRIYALLLAGLLLAVAPALIHYNSTPMLEQILGFHAVKADSPVFLKALFLLREGIPRYLLLLPLGLVGLYLALKEKRGPDVLLSAWALLSLAAIFIIRYPFYISSYIYLINAAPALALLAGRTADWLKDSWKQLFLKSVIVIVVFIHIGTFMSTYVLWHGPLMDTAEYMNLAEKGKITGSPVLAPAVAFLSGREMAKGAVDMNSIDPRFSDYQDEEVVNSLVDGNYVIVSRRLNIPVISDYANSSCRLDVKIRDIYVYDCRDKEK